MRDVSALCVSKEYALLADSTLLISFSKALALPMRDIGIELENDIVTPSK